MYKNIRDKKARIARGSGEKMRKPGEKGAPKKGDFERAAQTAKEEKKLIKFREHSKLNVWGELIQEAEYQGRKVELNNPTRGDVKKFKVYVKNDKGNVVKVNFGDTSGLSVKLKDPKRRKAFSDRHNCPAKKDKTKAGYWACRTGRYWKSLGGSRNYPGFW